jgi:hypothetical protein
VQTALYARFEEQPGSVMETNLSVSEQGDDLVVLTHSHVVSPSRQLMIKFGRFDLE